MLLEVKDCLKGTKSLERYTAVTETLIEAVNKDYLLLSALSVRYVYDKEDKLLIRYKDLVSNIIPISNIEGVVRLEGLLKALLLYSKLYKELERRPLIKVIYTEKGALFPIPKENTYYVYSDPLKFSHVEQINEIPSDAPFRYSITSSFLYMMYALTGEPTYINYNMVNYRSNKYAIFTQLLSFNSLSVEDYSRGIGIASHFNDNITLYTEFLTLYTEFLDLLLRRTSATLSTLYNILEDKGRIQGDIHTSNLEIPLCSKSL